MAIVRSKLEKEFSLKDYAEEIRKKLINPYLKLNSPVCGSICESIDDLYIPNKMFQKNILHA